MIETRKSPACFGKKDKIDGKTNFFGTQSRYEHEVFVSCSTNQRRTFYGFAEFFLRVEQKNKLDFRREVFILYLYKYETEIGRIEFLYFTSTSSVTVRAV